MNQVLDPDYLNKLKDYNSFEYLEQKQYRSQKLDKKRAIKDEIKKFIKFKESDYPIKHCRSNQTGDLMIFYDIMIDENSVKSLFNSNSIKDPEAVQKIRKYDICIGRSHGIRAHALYQQSYEFWSYIYFTLIPAIEESYQDYCRENLYGKKVLYDDYSLGKVYCKKDTIDMFDEWFIGEKIKSSFTKWLDETKEKYKDSPKIGFIEPTDEEQAFIDSIEMGKTGLFRECQDIIHDPDLYSGLKDWKCYIHAAEKILHTKFI